MGAWQPQNLGEPLSQIVQKDDAQDLAIISHQSGASVPSFLPEGGFWYRTTDKVILVATPGGSVTPLMATNQGQLLDANGSVALAAAFKAGGQKLTNLGAGTATTDAIQKQQAILVDGSQPWTANQSCNGNKLTNLGEATEAGDAVRLSQLADAVPAYVGRDYFQTNRDAAGNGQPARLEVFGDKANSSIVCGFVPRRVDILIDGYFYDYDDLEGTAENVSVEYSVRRWDDDPTGGYAAAGTVVLGVLPGPFGTENVLVELEWRFAPSDKLGFWLRATREAGSQAGKFQVLRRDDASRATIDGVIQIMARA